MPEAKVAIRGDLVDLSRFPSNSLPESLKSKATALAKRMKSLLPDNPIEKIALLKERVRRDPVLAAKINGRWYSLHQWE